MKIYSNGNMIEAGGGGVTMEQVDEAIDAKLDAYTPLDVYSTEENRIGTWVDGKPLYRKTYTVNTPATVTVASQKVADLPENATIINSYGIVIGTGGIAKIPAIFYGSNSFLCYVSSLFFTSGEIRLQIGHANYANRPCIITIEYTKTNDQATIELPTLLTAEPAQTISVPEYTSVASSVAEALDQNEEV